MIREKLGVLLLMLAACGLIAAGCGGDDDDSADGGGEASAQLEQCKQNVEDSELEGEAREAALNLCESAEETLESIEEGEVDPEELQDEAEQIQEDAVEACRQIAEEIPDESARDLALQNCENAGGGGE